ncbi:MAG: metal ion ABC transporter substrate-binding protein [Bdellovibrio sp. ArHS]|uniref:metal ABC transporter substrate-binding protein n=1 Tax=Bdellovibrio sp. ArHS TaxID=1569284 RepID=UPI000583F0B4|nr:metal ABC transporter substrate-binding protein [Bdellovibrio sp. ArHS]KHD89095.1 MAG: metal ion ABC transporter substrate-binding protein [Bdellovibrio sp. ArHS]
MKSFIFAMGVFCASISLAKIKVVTTLPEIAEVVQTIGGNEVETQSLLTGREDAHYAEARPDYILKVNRADVVCSMGLDLEVGWLPKVLEKAGNAQVQQGGKGFCVLGNAVKPLDVPVGVINRSLGDVHAQGNPHFNLSPAKLIEAGAEVLRVLSALEPAKATEFSKNYDSFKKTMTNLQTELQKSVKKIKVMEYHKEFTYFFNVYGIESLGSLEEKPGVPPSAARLAQVAKLAKENHVAILFATPSAPHKALERFTELSGIPVVTVPSYVQTSGSSAAKTIEGLQKLLVKSLP